VESAVECRIIISCEAEFEHWLAVALEAERQRLHKPEAVFDAKHSARLNESLSDKLRES